MAGRPLRLVYTPPTWATAGNYPAGANPWNAQPMRVAPATGYYLPGTVPPAEYANYLHGSALDGLATLEGAIWSAFDFFTGYQTQNFPFTSGSYFTASGTATSGASSIAWDQFLRRWVAMDATTGSLNAYQSLDYGVTWTQLAGGGPIAGGHSFALVAHPTTGLLVTFRNGSPYTYAASTWTVQTTPFTTSFVASAAIYFNSLFICMGGTSGAAKMMSGTAAGTTWTDRSAQIPAGLSAAVAWLAATNGTTVIGMPYLSNVRVSMTSTDGTTWAAGSFASGSLVGTDLLTGLAYSAVDGLFMACFTGAANISKILTSPDGLTWTYLRSLTATPMVGLNACGSVWMSLTGASLALANQAIFSVNKGVTWAFTPASLIADTSTNKDVQGVFASDVNLMVANSSQMRSCIAGGAPLSTIT